MQCTRKVTAFVLLICKLTLTYSQSPTHAIKIHPNGYRGHLAISGSTTFFFLRSDTTVAINSDNRGMYSLNTGASIGGDTDLQTSYIYLTFKGDSIVSVHPSESVLIGKDQKSIYLNTVPIAINPDKFKRNWTLSSDTIANYYSGKKTIQLIKGITYSINQADAVLNYNCRLNPATNNVKCDLSYGSYFYFTVNKNGEVILYDKNHISAVALGRTLLFKTVCTTIDPKLISGGIPVYIPTLDKHPILVAKQTKCTFIRGTVNYVYWGNPGKEMYFHFLPL